MNINIDESQVIINKQINIQESISKKVNIKDFGYRFAKRTMDIFAGLIGVITLIPLTVIIYIANFITKNKGPIFYTEEKRIGKDGKLFTMYKYRSMVINADEKLKKYLAENEEARKEYKKYKKLKKDPRITKVGEFIRKTSIDEFPQFINVLKGDMSLVGPRPYLHREKDDMGDNYDIIVSVKPGLTGYWQVNGRSDKDFKERTEMDVAYVKDKNLWLDIKFVIKTALKIFVKEGAM